MPTLRFGQLISIAYSKRGQTINADFDKSPKDQQAMNSNRLAVFADSLHCTVVVKVVSKGTPRPLTD